MTNDEKDILTKEKKQGHALLSLQIYCPISVYYQRPPGPPGPPGCPG